MYGGGAAGSSYRRHEEKEGSVYYGHSDHILMRRGLACSGRPYGEWAPHGDKAVLTEVRKKEKFVKSCAAARLLSS
jgi:hypothetical protein